MGFQYKRVLLIGATSGIGASMADKLVREGAKVIAVGRRQDRLEDFVKRHGADKASYVKYDITDREGLDGFVKSIVTTHPDLDCVFLNAGVQNEFSLKSPETVDLDAFHKEVETNFTSVVNLSTKFLPHLLKKDYPTSMVLTGTHLSIVPAVTMPAYSSSKAASRVYFDCLRRQNQGSNVTFTEISAPPVQTELHDYMGAQLGRTLGMPLEEFTDQAYAQLAQNEEEIQVGMPGTATKEEYDQLLGARKTIFERLSNVLMARFA